MTTPELLAGKYSAPVPRYTSYPTAPHFSGAVNEEIYRRWLFEIDRSTPVSIYLHIPFCDKLCWFCGCHTKHTTKYEPVSAYLDVLLREIELVREAMGFSPEVAHLHLGGGSPSLLRPADMDRLRKALDKSFRFTPSAEISIEIDPSDANDGLYEALLALGVTRASIGVQDFNEEVQRAINRPQSFEMTRDVVEMLRKTGIASVNIDALYGLPHQSCDRLAGTIAKVVSLDPDRIALFGYAHVPWMKKHQTLIDEDHLPDVAERFRQARLAERMLVNAGYDAIGIDHFAKPEDGLAIAAAGGKLHRNFQGYTADDCETLIGLGASSIGRTKQGFVQNIPATGQYSALIGQGKLPVARGLALSADDLVRGKFIELLMCNFKVDLATFRASNEAGAETLLREAEAAARSDSDGLCKLENGCFIVPFERRPFVRTVASWFDAYMQKGAARYSVAV
jgi:oxygen-independent coproporphyrinogen-3 oxidase